MTPPVILKRVKTALLEPRTISHSQQKPTVRGSHGEGGRAKTHKFHLRIVPINEKEKERDCSPEQDAQNLLHRNWGQFVVGFLLFTAFVKCEN